MKYAFLMVGQSNMAGRGYAHEVEPIINENILMLRNGRWQMMEEPINFDRSVAGVGLASSFASAWCKDHPNSQIGLIPCAEGGTCIDEWAIDGPLFQHAINEAKFALKDSTLVGILWHQGENDSFEGRYITYQDKLKTIMDAFRLELDCPSVPIIVGGLPDFLGSYGFGKGCIEYKQINQALKDYVASESNAYFVDAADLQSNPDGIHINALSQRKFGLRYYDAFINAHNVLQPLANEELRLRELEAKENTKSEKIFCLSKRLVLGDITYEEFVQQLTTIQ